MICVGIDVAKDTHWACALDAGGRILLSRAVRNAQADLDAFSAELRALPIEQREVIVAHLWGGLTFEQIAEVAGCSSSTAHRSYSAGLATLRSRLGESCRTSRPIPK